MREYPQKYTRSEEKRGAGSRIEFTHNCAERRSSGLAARSKSLCIIAYAAHFFLYFRFSLVAMNEVIKRLLAALLIGLFSSACYAYQVEGLFNAEVDVYDRSAAQRSMGIKRAFEKVLIKVSGSRDVILVPGLIPDNQQIERIVEQFRYSEIERPEPAAPVSGESPISEHLETDSVGALGGEGTVALPAYKLWVGFDTSAVLRLLQKANLPVWDKTRPLALTWLAVQDGAGRYLLDPEIHQETADFIERQAAERGLPVAFPLMDLEDRSALTLTDVWGDFADSIKQASSRYGADVILVGRVFHESESVWSVRWTLYQGEEIVRWETRGDDNDAALLAGIHGAADVLAKRYAQVLSANLEPPLTLTLIDINSFEQYAKAINYLEGLTQIASLNVVNITQGRIDVNVSIRGSLAGLEKVIKLGGILIAVEKTSLPKNIPGSEAMSSQQQPTVLDPNNNQGASANFTPSVRGIVYRLRP